MIRKFISVGLSTLGVLALLGAGVVQEEETSSQNMSSTNFVTATLGANLKQVVPTGVVEETTELEEVLEEIPQDDQDTWEEEAETEGFLFLESEDDTNINMEDIVVLEEETPEILEVPEEEEVVVPTKDPDFVPSSTGGDDGLKVNGFPVNTSVNRYVEAGITYVSFLEMSKALDATAEGNWNQSTKTATVQTSKMSLEAKAGQFYMVANGRYLYLEQTVLQGEEDVYVPLSMLARAFDATVLWDPQTGEVSVITGSGAIESGDTFYDEDDLFWLSRVIFAESGNQPVEGQMGVAIVVYNRVNNSVYPDTVLGVLSQKNQFSTYQNGGLANRTPNTSSVIAAKLVMDGGVVTELAKATHFDSLANSWAGRNLSVVSVIGGHTFYA